MTSKQSRDEVMEETDHGTDKEAVVERSGSLRCRQNCASTLTCPSLSLSSTLEQPRRPDQKCQQHLSPPSANSIDSSTPSPTPPPPLSPLTTPPPRQQPSRPQNKTHQQPPNGPASTKGGPCRHASPAALAPARHRSGLHHDRRV